MGIIEKFYLSTDRLGNKYVNKLDQFSFPGNWDFKQNKVQVHPTTETDQTK